MFKELTDISQIIKNLPANAVDIRVTGLISVLGRSPEGGHGNLLQYSCLENPMDRGAWQATVHRVAQSWPQMKKLSMHTYTISSLQVPWRKSYLGL